MIRFGPLINPKLNRKARTIGRPIKQRIRRTGGTERKNPNKESLAVLWTARFSLASASLEVVI